MGSLAVIPVERFPGERTDEGSAEAIEDQEPVDELLEEEGIDPAVDEDDDG